MTLLGRHVPLLHPDRRLDRRHGVAPITSRPYPIGRNCTAEAVITPQKPILVEAIRIESLCDADHWMIEDVRLGYHSLRCWYGSRFLERRSTARATATSCLAMASRFRSRFAS